MEINWSFFQTAPWWQITIVIIYAVLMFGLLVFGFYVLYKIATFKIDDEWWKHLEDKNESKTEANE